MRFLGNKESLLQEIESLLKEKNILDKRYVFFDAFCGSGSVSNHFAKYYDIILNDNLNWAVIYSFGRIVANKCNFSMLGCDPFSYLNSNESQIEGFFYKTYCPSKDCNRMYFSVENAKRIDYFRQQIEEWKKQNLLSENEYFYLLACLIESVSSVSNTAGVYGAFLKHWDSRALKPIVFSKVDSCYSTSNSVKFYNEKIENVVESIDCDILYIDPPYTQNQYGTQYHLLETLVLNDNPSVSKITGSRPTAPMRSDWSKDYKCHILFDRLLAKTKAKYVLFSYNNDGFMSKTFIESSMKRYGNQETFICKKIPYKKYQNWKSQNENEHFEYLFFVELKDKKDVIYESPLNYIGSKAKVINDIKSNLAPNVYKFIDAFGGGFNVGVNIDCSETIYNDNNFIVSELIESFRKIDTYQYVMFVKKIIQQFNLKPADKEAYLAIRNYYNNLPKEKRDPRLLFTIILYGFQQQIRFNSNLDFNNPVGMRWFNDKVLEKLISFSRKIKEENCYFLHDNYKRIPIRTGDNIFFYMDPPYELTTGAYNDGKRGFLGWNKHLEKELFDFSDKLSSEGIPFMLSYVSEHKGKKNEELLKWVEKNKYRIIELGDVIGISGSRRKEILITNYGAA